MIKDGHVHTPFCPHGSADPLEKYVEKAISLGMQSITFTEHAPLPINFSDPVPVQDSAMDLARLQDYFSEIEHVKKLYCHKITIQCGLEVDYIEGFEKEIRSFLDTYGEQLDDSILSVHFLRHKDIYHCVDYSPDVFAQMIEKYGSIEAVYDNYYRTLLLSVTSDLGKHKPKRIGHVTLVKKFQKKYPIHKDYKEELLYIFSEMKKRGYELDYNGAGTAKPLCQETYPPRWAAMLASELGIQLVYGSDAHQAKEVGQGTANMII